ncbi:hypothetical protein [Oceanirhabdus sp. W0125-5]|uniref:hypothetical protein n=1 Tax=Oceanirhabdus sp. W0125-5 TaxID=2999116 RepID=UPI0022F303E8|nr:hypothetical protein [Oceanirhabdus sp. W0125-5]WBW96678.1 hypothetical protein OW730_23740 [Oceanirhabdus sp. W0125-5]
MKYKKIFDFTKVPLVLIKRLIFKKKVKSDIRDLIYINYNICNKEVVSYGIEFKEFILALKEKPNYLLVIEGNYWGSGFDFNTRCQYSDKADLNEFIEENVYSYGDFCWVDFEDEENLNKLKPIEVAELLYLGKLGKPINKPLFEKLSNRFVYLAHDDGWYNHTYYRNEEDYKDIIYGVINSKIKRLYNFNIDYIGDEILNKIIRLSEEGCAIDIKKLRIDKDNQLSIPIYIIGKHQDMDEVYSLCREKEVIVNYELIMDDDLWELRRQAK